MHKPLCWGRFTGALLLCGVAAAVVCLPYRTAYSAAKDGAAARRPLMPRDTVPPSVITGVVLGPNGKPSSGAFVYSTAITIQSSLKTVSDARGCFSIQGVPGRSLCLFARKGRDATVINPTVTTGSFTTLKLVSNPVAQIAGTVVDDRETPLRRVRVALYLDHTVIPIDTVLTDRRGRFRFRNVIPHSGYFLEISRVGYGYGEVQPPFPIGIRQKRVLRTITIPKADSFVSGIVVDKTGKPVAGINVFTVQVCGAATRTDAHGHFRLAPVLEGLVYLDVKPGFGEAQVDSGTTDARIVLQ